MLWVVYNEGTAEFAEAEFHVGGKDRKIVYETSITRIQADGDELEAIREQFTGIPMSTARVVVWYGEMSRFIAGNIRL
jgi:hypothetical protein